MPTSRATPGVLTELSPQALLELGLRYLRETRIYPGGKPFCAERLWHTEFKPKLMWLAGFRAQNHRLRNRMAYEVALDVNFQEVVHSVLTRNSDVAKRQ